MNSYDLNCSRLAAVAPGGLLAGEASRPLLWQLSARAIERQKWVDFGPSATGLRRH